MPSTHFSIEPHDDAWTPQSKLPIRRYNRGFTLVELMVAMALLGALTSIIYGLFHTTSQTLLEVETLAETTDTARFALEHVRNDLQAAGSQASPRSTYDPWVVQSGITVTGIVPYRGWQGTQSYPDGSTQDDMARANPKSRFDGMIVVGAYDIPQAVMIQNIEAGLTKSTAHIAEHVRGVQRLINSDPFNTSPVPPLDLAAQLEAVSPEKAMSNRILRVTDRQGFIQFTPIETARRDLTTLRVDLGKLHAATGDSLVGIDEVSETDVEYEAAFLDGFWYHVVKDPFDPTNYQLVRDRLNLNSVDFDNYSTFDPTSAATDGNLPIERVVIANRVVDFRLWFDCGTSANGHVTNVAWHTNWDSPADNNTNNINTCLENNVELARVAHIRLSIRTSKESTNRQHLTIIPGWEGFESEQTRMQTYDIDPRSPGSASVVTVQTAVELSNFAMRNLLTRQSN